ncbi:hypothetical protein BDV96DRAFT_564272 [Lophiotrema nucula]|uniref:Uncharacterized protein n=1 Tax=Lophiotrema nucula TaxID=690887 RepID=A0A6A5ZRG4_9PLEO|nr:hypothetical protein BDV96DRAFT_564272 [Lophiotrema nucula]
MLNFVSGGYTALHFAARYGRVEIMSLLLSNGADANVTSDRGEYVSSSLQSHVRCLDTPNACLPSNCRVLKPSSIPVLKLWRDF